MTVSGMERMWSVRLRCVQTGAGAISKTGAGAASQTEAGAVFLRSSNTFSPAVRAQSVAIRYQLSQLPRQARKSQQRPQMLLQRWRREGKPPKKRTKLPQSCCHRRVRSWGLLASLCPPVRQCRCNANVVYRKDLD